MSVAHFTLELIASVAPTVKFSVRMGVRNTENKTLVKNKIRFMRRL